MIERQDIHLEFHGAEGRAIAAPPGYHVRDFFTDWGAWMDDPMESAADVFAKADAHYRGPDGDGIGLRVRVTVGGFSTGRNLRAPQR